MKQAFYILTILCFLTSCGQSVDSKDDLRKVTIDFADAVIEIPQSYQETSTNDLRKDLLNSNKPDNVIQNSIGKLEIIESYPTPFIIYADTANFDNCIWFQQGEYVELTKSISSQYLGMLEQQLEQNWKPQGIEYKRLESKYFSGNNAQIIKLKYQLTHDTFTRYTTQYIVSRQNTTIGVVVYNQKLDDFEDLVKGMKIE